MKAGSSQKGKILVVDDDDLARMLIDVILTEHGFEVVQAENGEAALDVLEKQDDIVAAIIDVCMPKLDGLTLVHRLRGVGGSISTLPIIMMGGYDSKLRRDEAKRAGVDLYISKPMDPGVLADAISSMLRTKA